MGITEAVISFVLLLLFILFDLSLQLEVYIRNFISSDYLTILIFVLALSLISLILFAPFNYYTGYYLEHKYNLSNQTFWKWIFEGLKGSLVGAVIGIPLLFLFYYTLKSFGINWWLPFGVLMFIVSVVLAQIVPIIILPKMRA